MVRGVWSVLLCLSTASIARADDAGDARELMHVALEAAAPIAAVLPAFTMLETRPATGQRDGKSPEDTQAAKAAAEERASAAVRDAHASAASKVGVRSARDAAQAAQSDANGDAARNRSKEKRKEEHDNGKKNGATPKK